MLLELDRSSARTLATSYSDEHGLEPTFDDVLIPALILAGDERIEDQISQENQELIVETTRDLVQGARKQIHMPRTRTESCGYWVCVRLARFTIWAC